VNDVHGHHEGDEMLRLVAGAIRGTIRISDVAARMGGDEFVLLLPETGLAEAQVSLGRLSRALGDSLEKSPHPVTASIGAVVFGTVADGVDAMIRAADRRMYMAKAAGKDRVVVELAEGPAEAGLASRQVAE
jgi:diguanylate cyclase (GGDEF)-like protein